MTIIAAAERLYFCDLHWNTDESRPVAGGLGVCDRTGRLWVMGRTHVSIADLVYGRVIKRLTVFEADRTDTTAARITVGPTEDITAMTTGGACCLFDY